MKEGIPNQHFNPSEEQADAEASEPVLGFDADPKVAASQSAFEAGIVRDYEEAAAGSIAQDSANRMMWGD